MAMTLRLSEEEAAALRAFAAESGRSMQDVARDAIRAYLSDHVRRRQEILDRIVAQDAKLLDLLAQ